MQQSMDSLKGLDFKFDVSGVKFEEVPIRNVKMPIGDDPFINFEIQKGKRFVSASVSKIYGLDCIRLEQSSGSYVARVWTFGEPSVAEAVFRAECAKAISAEQNRVTALFSALYPEQKTMKSYVFVQDFGFISAGRVLKEDVNGNFFLSAKDEEVIDGSLPWIGSVKLTRQYVESLPESVIVARSEPKE